MTNAAFLLFWGGVILLAFAAAAAIADALGRREQRRERDEERSELRRHARQQFDSLYHDTKGATE